MELSNKFMLFDSEEGYYDIILFSEPIDTEEIRKIIRDLAQKDEAYWQDLETIENKIKEKFKVEKIILFSVGECDLLDIEKF